MKRCQKWMGAVFFLGLIGVPALAKDLITSNVGYIRGEKIAELEIPPIKGEYYSDLIPDTLDIAERAELSINAMTGNADPDCDYAMYWDVTFDGYNSFMGHNFNDWCGVKFQEAALLLRMITGSTLNSQVDPVWLNVMLRSIGEDGLFYIPMGGRPWARIDVQWGPNMWRADGTKTNIGDMSVTQFTHPMPVGRAINVMMIQYQMDKNPKWKTLIEKMIDRSLELMVDKGEYGYIPAGFFEPNAKVGTDAEVPAGTLAVESHGRLIQAPANYYRMTGYEPAKKLAQKIIHCVRYQGQNFDAEGRFLDQGSALFHGNTCALLSMADFAGATEDAELMKFVEKSFLWARKQGSPTVGFYPEFADPNHPSSESCAVADMIVIAMKLSKAGVGDYWDDADRWIRNQFAEAQLTKIDWIYSIDRSGEKKEEENNNNKPLPPGTRTYKNVPERNIGAFAGFATPNDWAGNGYIMPCCTANGARTLYYIWKHLLDYENGQLTVNLLLNRASPWVDVYSYIPYEGQVRLRIKEPCTKVKVRVPEWIPQNSPDVKCVINDKDSGFRWEGRYIDLGVGNPGDRIKIVFPISERTVQEKIVHKDYTLVIRGNTVISIDPPGKICPLYQREYYRSNMPWRPVTRFLAERVIDY
jgi:hypothetical protein